MEMHAVPVQVSAWDVLALGDLLRRISRPGMRVAEIGSWIGNGSTRVLIEALRSVPDARLFCIDTWVGPPGTATAPKDIYAAFQANVAAAGGQSIVEAITSGSSDAAARFDNGAFDLVFIDGDHRYSAVSADIAAWAPKVRPGGILAGHDCEFRPSWLDRLRLRRHREKDCIWWGTSKRTPDIHPGVILAVHEAFGGDVNLFTDKRVKLPDGRSGCSTIWWRQIGGNEEAVRR